MTSPAGRVRLGEFGRFLEIQNLGLNLPFLLAFLFVASHGWPSLRVTVLVLVAFVAARNAGHSFNRWADRRYDAANPRTRQRALVTGRIPTKFALGFSAAMISVLVVCAYLLNPLALILAPVAIGLVLGYSYTKRHTPLTTSFLGLVEAITPAAVFVGVTGALPLAGFVASIGILLWGTAFETIHSLGDLDADRMAGLHSLPLSMGIDRSVTLVPILHAGALTLLGLTGVIGGLGVPFFLGLAGMAAVLVYTDSLVIRHPTRTSRPFRHHFALSVLFLLGTTVSFLVPVN